MKTRYFEVEKVRDINEELREATFVISTERAVQMGSEREVLRASGAKLDRYRKNPVLLDAHDRSSVSSVLGSATVSIVGNQVHARLRYAKTTKGEEAWQLVRDGHVRGTSIGYNPNAEKTRKLRKGEADGDLTGPVSIVDEWELLEISNVPVPADEDAVRRSYRAPKGRQKMAKISYADLLEQLAAQERSEPEGEVRAEDEMDKDEDEKGERASEVTCPGCGKSFAPAGRAATDIVPRSAPAPKVTGEKPLGIEIQARTLKAARECALAITPPGLEDVTTRALAEGRPLEEIRKLLLLAQKQRFTPLGTPEPEKREDGGPAPKGLPADISDDVLVRSLGNLGE